MAKRLSDRPEPAAPEAEVPLPVAAPSGDGSQGAAPAGPPPPPVGQASASKAAGQKECYATIYPGEGVKFPAEVLSCVRELEAGLGISLWLLFQDEHDHRKWYNNLDWELADAFFQARHRFAREKPVALLLHTAGGDAKSAYQIARLMRTRCGFAVVIPRYAKSAGTLLALGADRIILADDAELGPLDAQVYDVEREEWSSALDEVQALERLLAFTLQAVDAAVLLVAQRSGKKIGSILPGVHQFVTDMTRPLFEKIDTVHYTMMSRILKVAEYYAIRLLQPRYPKNVAEEIAMALVTGYPEHGFMIDGAEASAIGLMTETLNASCSPCMDRLLSALDGRTVLGELREVT